ncbi:lipid storage droplets surface-binding protein 2 isoform X1 [Ixodes scapularis]|uniref:lipid storage droplets surface-binding protein 2 isoform X1 n=1 Tax=Ixodes scapularis TaxID=6945 RepID=UPI001A9EE55E|nr:lipid storage droplets surface-binding protein 2 isoform X1 [Ixodes scapularis]
MPEVTETPRAAAAAAAQYHFIGRLYELPAVASAWETAAQSYIRVKGSNGLLAYAIDTAEKSAALAVERGLPVVNKIAGTPLNYVDGLACKGLDKLEEAYPGVKKNAPEQIVADAVDFGRKKYGDVKEYGFAKINGIKTASADTIQLVGHPVQTMTLCSNQILTYTKQALEATETTLDQHITSLGLEATKATPRDPEHLALVERLDSISKKATTCATKHAANQLAALQRYATDSLTRFQVALQLIENMREHLGTSNQPFQETLAKMSLGSAWLQDLLNNTSESGVNFQKNILEAAQGALSALTAALQKPALLVRGMSAQAQDAYTRLLSSASDMLQTITGVNNIGELTSTTVGALQQQATQLQYSIRHFTSLGLSWLASLPIVERLVPAAATEMKSMGSETTQSLSSSDAESSSDESS